MKILPTSRHRTIWYNCLAQLSKSSLMLCQRKKNWQVNTKKIFYCPLTNFICVFLLVTGPCYNKLPAKGWHLNYCRRGRRGDSDLFCSHLSLSGIFSLEMPQTWIILSDFLNMILCKNVRAGKTKNLQDCRYLNCVQRTTFLGWFRFIDTDPKCPKNHSWIRIPALQTIV